MAKKRKPDDIVNLKLRFTEALRSRIEQEAEKNHRSLNSEIVYRLGTTFGAEGAEMAAMYEKGESELKDMMQEILRDFIASKRAEGQTK
jgi:hypothetical protein